MTPANIDWIRIVIFSRTIKDVGQTSVKKAYMINDDQYVTETIRATASPALLHAKDKRADHLGGPTKDYNYGYDISLLSDS